jgi:hypothetical protein
VSADNVFDVNSCAISKYMSENYVPNNAMCFIDGIFKRNISNDMERKEVHEEEFIMPIFSSSIYRVYSGKHDNLMQPINAAFDTFASSYIILHDVLPSGVTVHPCETKPRLVDENRSA